MDKGGQGQTHKNTRTRQHLHQFALKSFQPFIRYCSGWMDGQTVKSNKIINKSKIKCVCKLQSNKTKLANTAGAATKEQLIKLIRSKYE